MDSLIKILWCSDFVVQTGFGRVAESILKYLPPNKYDINILAVNYFGDPHTYPYKIYPGPIGGDMWGLNRLPALCENIKPDLIFILDDMWIVDRYLEIIKKIYKDKTLPKIVVYFPVDATEHFSGWYRHLDIVKPVVYNSFGYDVAKKAAPNYEYRIISHGVDTTDFYHIDKSKRDIKKSVYPDKEEFLDSFIVLNANRNQIRKKLDISMLAFSLFAKGKPENVKLYMHCFPEGQTVYLKDGIKDIKDVLPGDEVLTHTGKYQKVKNIQKRNYSGKLLDISFVGGEKIRVTPEHPFLTVNRKYCNQPNNNFCNSWCKVKDKELSDGIITHNCGKRFYEQYKLNWETAKNLDKSFCLYCKPPEILYNESSTDSLQMARLCGYYTAEGNCSKYGVTFTTSIKETPIHEDILLSMQDIFNLDDSDCKEYQYTAHSASHQYFKSTEASEYLSKECGRGAYNKKIPEFILNGNEETIIEYLSTLFQGDGTYNQRLGYFKLTTFSKTLAYQVKLALLKIHIPSSIKVCTNSGKFNGYSIDIWGENAIKLSSLFSMQFKSETNRSYNKLGFYLNGGVYPITSVDEEDFSGDVYNFEVENDNSYTINGVVVHNCGVRDSGFDIEELTRRYKIESRVILTSKTEGIQQVPKERLNLIYNATDVGINTSLGEGFGLPGIEQSVTGAPQVVADHSALHDLYKDCGILIPTAYEWTLDNIMTVGKVVLPEDMAAGLELLYTNKDLYSKLSKASVTKFSNEKYSWKNISLQWDLLFDEVLSSK
jgi:glycosyltransferase involved in cell wall biosynthesis